MSKEKHEEPQIITVYAAFYYHRGEFGTSVNLIGRFAKELNAKKAVSSYGERGFRREDRGCVEPREAAMFPNGQVYEVESWNEPKVIFWDGQGSLPSADNVIVNVRGKLYKITDKQRIRLKRK